MIKMMTAKKSLIEATIAMHQSGLPLMRRIAPDDASFVQWDHYPENDAVSPTTGARYFYHCHPPEERGSGEHGHFHLFLPKSAMPDDSAWAAAPVDASETRPDVVHIAALTISPEGIPLSLFTVNRWVTDEWMFPAPMIKDVLATFDLSDAPGDPLVNQWLTAFVAVARKPILTLLDLRDRAAADPEDRNAEILSMSVISLETLVSRS